MASADTSTPLLANRRDISSGMAMASNGPENAETGVLLLNMGGPDSLEAVKPFLTNIFADSTIIGLPGGKIGQFFLGKLIVNRRLPKVRENYLKIGGRSPILDWTRLQMEGVQDLLSKRTEQSVKVGMAMRYWHPFADEALRILAVSGVKHVVGLTLYPHFSRATTGSSETDLLKARDRLGLDLPISFISHWYDDPAFLDLWAGKIEKILEGMRPEVRESVQLVVSAHGLPRKFVDEGDPYVEHIEATMKGVLKKLTDPPPAHLCFQSRSGPAEWIGPSTGEVIRSLVAEGHDALLIWPISFVSDHVETLYELDSQYRQSAAQTGIEENHMVPSLNDDPDFFAVLADLVETHMKNLDEVPVR